MKLTVKNGQTIFDIALIAYSDASMVYTLIEENPQIENILSDLTGMELSFTQIVSTNPKEALKLQESFKRTVVISSTQSIFDIALQYTGSAENVYELIGNNPQIENILSDPTGITLNYTLNTTYIPEYYRASNITLSTKPLIKTFSHGSSIATEDGSGLLQESGSYILIE